MVALVTQLKAVRAKALRLPPASPACASKPTHPPHLTSMPALAVLRCVHCLHGAVWSETQQPPSLLACYVVA